MEKKKIVEVERGMPLFKDLYWTCKIVQKNKYEYLKVDRTRFYSTDGRRAHIVNLQSISPGLYSIIKINKSIIQLEVTAKIDRFPDIDNVIPKGLQSQEFSESDINILLFKINTELGVCINFDFLRDAEAELFKTARIRCSPSNPLSPIILEDHDNIRMALIMPIKRV